MLLNLRGARRDTKPDTRYRTVKSADGEQVYTIDGNLLNHGLLDMRGNDPNFSDTLALSPRVSLSVTSTGRFSEDVQAYGGKATLNYQF